MDNTQAQPQPNASPAVAKLYTLSRPQRKWTDYIGRHEITAEDIPALIDIITNKELLYFEGEAAAAEVVIHAYRALAQLNAAEALPAMVGLYQYEPDDVLGDHFTEDLPTAIEMIGESGLPYLQELLPRGHEIGFWGQSFVAHTIGVIGRDHPHLREDCLNTLAAQLEQYSNQGDDLNAKIIVALCEMKAAEVAPLIEQVYEADRVDWSIVGDWEDVQVALGILDKRETPRPRYNGFGNLFSRADEDPVVAEKRRVKENRTRLHAHAKKKKAKAKKKHRR